MHKNDQFEIFGHKLASSKSFDIDIQYIDKLIIYQYHLPQVYQNLSHTIITGLEKTEVGNA